MPDNTDVPDVPEAPDKNERIRLPANISTPEQGCVGCAIAVTLLTLSVAFWLYIWWLKEPNMHVKTPTPTPSPVASPIPGASATPPAQTILRYNRPIPQN